MFSFYESPGIIDIGEDAGRTAKYLFLQVHSFIKRDVILDFASIPYSYLRSNDHVLPDGNIFPQDGPL